MAKFEPYYDRVLGSHISSQRDQDKKMKAHRSKSHPDGLYNIRDDKKFMKEMSDIQRNREMYKASVMPGYKPKTERELEQLKRHGGEHAFDRNRPGYDPRYHRS